MKGKHFTFTASDLNIPQVEKSVISYIVIGTMEKFFPPHLLHIFSVNEKKTKQTNHKTHSTSTCSTRTRERSPSVSSSLLHGEDSISISIQ